MLLILSAYEGGIDVLISTTLFQPLIGLAVAVVTAISCYIARLPIRLHLKWRKWWTARPFIPLAGMAIGILVIILSITPYFAETILPEGEDLYHIVPNAGMGICGWLLTSFSLMHFFPLEFLQNRLLRK